MSDQPVPIAPPKAPRLTCYRVDANPMPIVPGEPERVWMNNTDNRFAYRCLPLAIANSSGWEIRAPAAFTVQWNGGAERKDLIVHADATMARKAVSHFAHGILTIHTGYLFRTDPGWGVWARGAPNVAKDGIAPLDGLIETDWLPFPFTMNWQMTRPGFVSFAKGEPLCFITPMPHFLLDEITPDIRDIAEDPGLEAEYATWRDSRNAFNQGLAQREPHIMKQGWQKFYVRGQDAVGTVRAGNHISRRRLATPIVDNE